MSVSPMSSALLLFTALTLTACTDPGPDQVLAPRQTAPPMASFAAGADQSWLRTSFNVDYVQFVPCLGENARLYGEVPFQLHTVANPAGGFNAHRQLRAITPNSPPFRVQVISTGKVYTQVNGGPINEVIHVAAGEVYSFHEVDTFRAADGSELYFTFVIHGTVNANGVATAEKFIFENVNCG